MDYKNKNKNTKWLNAHGWFCDVESLRDKIFPLEQTQFIGGVVQNISELADEFDKVFVLDLETAELLSRLSNRKDHFFGKTLEEQDYVKNTKKEFFSQLNKKVVIETTGKTPDQVVEIILQKLIN